MKKKRAEIGQGPGLGSARGDGRCCRTSHPGSLAQRRRCTSPPPATSIPDRLQSNRLEQVKKPARAKEGDSPK